MITTRYKPLFSVSVTYQQPDLSVSAQGITVDTMPVSQIKMTDLSLVPLDKENVATVYYKGLETPPAAPLTSEPQMEITSNESFYFELNFIDKKLIPLLKFHSTGAIAKEIGFPLLYDATINTLNGPAVFTTREDVKVSNAIFTFTAIAATTGITGSYATIEVKDESNNPVQINNNIAPLNDKQIDGPGAVPEFAFSIDLSLQPPGVYTLKVGNFQKRYFITNGIVIGNQTAIIRILKNNNLTYHKTLADNSFSQFNLVIPKA